MSFISNKLKSSSERGFTIVELLIVIVVIGILAAITIVSFNGVTAKANTTTAKSAATSALKKAEAYNADGDTTGYPTYPSQLTSTTAQAQPYGLSGVTFTTGTGGTTPNFTTAPTTVPANAATLNFYSCGTAGVRVTYWDYSPSTGSPRWINQSTGTCADGTGTYKSTGATS